MAAVDRFRAALAAKTNGATSGSKKGKSREVRNERLGALKGDNKMKCNLCSRILQENLYKEHLKDNHLNEVAGIVAKTHPDDLIEVYTHLK